MTPPDRLQRILNETKAIIFAKWCRLFLAWAVVLLIAGVRQHISHNMFNCQKLPAADDSSYADVQMKRRADGNKGHTHIDFGGQWVFARTLMTGHGKQLYHRSVHWKIASAGLPISSQSPLVQKYGWPGMYPPAPFEARDCITDVDYLLGNMMGADHEQTHVAPIREAVGLGLLGMSSPNPFAAAALQLEAEKRLTPDIVEEFAKPVIGGPLYPPTHPFFYAPIGLMENPQQAYFAFQNVSILACFACGWLVQILSRGRIWLPVATAVIMLAPGCQPGIDLGQNHVFTLLILLGGWTLASRGYDYAGGAAWGLLAFKPVWGLAFILAPLMLRRWKFVIGTAVAGLAFVGFTIPFVGVQAWLDWLAVGKDAAALYNVDANWIHLSRDVSGLTKRLMLDFDIARNKLDPTIPNIVSNVALAFVVVVTLGVYIAQNNRRKLYIPVAGVAAVLFALLGALADPLKPFLTKPSVWEVLFWLSLFAFLTNVILHLFSKDQRPTLGLSAGFLLLGTYLCGYRFMYYDGLLAILGFAVLLVDPGALLQGTSSRWQSTPDGRQLQVGRNSPLLTILVLLILVATLVMWMKPEVTLAIGNWKTPYTKADGTVIQRAKQLSAVGDWNHGIDTWLVLLAWALCAGRLLIYGDTPRSASSAVPMSGERMSDSPTSTA